MKIKIVLISWITYTLFISSCANTDIYGGNVYNYDRAKKVQSVKFGTIVSVYPVKIQARKTGIGETSGSIIAGSAASSIGNSDRTNIAAGAAGAVVGAIIGSKMEEKLTQVQALELTISIDGGENIVVVQKYQPNLRKGARVRVVGDGSSVNVNPI